MLKSLMCSKIAAFALLVLIAQGANADQLFTNWSGAVVTGNLWTSGGPCPSCYALEDNFSNPVSWDVTDITFYVVLVPSVSYNASNWRYAMFDAEVGGNAIVAPTDAGSSLVFTDTGVAGPTLSGGTTTEIYKGVISGLNINLPAGTYWFRFTNTQSQAVYPADASQPSAQTISPGLAMIYGDPSDALLSPNLNQTSDNWAFEVGGIGDQIFANGFEGP
jgi:hypothetical protein